MNEVLNNPYRNYSQALNFIFIQASLFTQKQVSCNEPNQL
jgi:hypothetical protein